MEYVQDQVSKTLLTLEKPQLVLVCQHLKCKEPEKGGFESLARRALIRLAENTLEETEEGEEAEQFLQYLKDLLSFIKSQKNNDEDPATPNPD